MRSSEPVLLFAYGTLAPTCADEAAQGGWAEDEVRGWLYDLGPYPALVGLDDPTSGWIKGYVRPIDPAELEARLDAYEGVGEGLYRRVLATTRAGRRAWVYVYARPLPADAREVPGGKWRPDFHEERRDGNLSQPGLEP